MKSVTTILALLLLHGALLADQSVSAKPVAMTSSAASLTQTVASGISANELPTHGWYRTAVLILGVGAVSICFAQAFLSGQKKA